ncbi:hypothetical protein, partial [Streptomyces sp. NPDC101149]|uniref:hypothetical protein n=1 Tax=Streptomyces sp. NPDC101149 TaxID=3366113 RepID=UPI0037FB73F8
MSEALDRVIEALAGASEDEVTAALSAVGISGPRPPMPSVALRTPLPGPEASLHIVSEVEWV